MPRGWTGVAKGGSERHLSMLMSAQTTATHARQLCVMLLLEFSTVRAQARTTAQTRANYKKNWRLALSPFVWTPRRMAKWKLVSSKTKFISYCSHDILLSASLYFLSFSQIYLVVSEKAPFKWGYGYQGEKISWFWWMWQNVDAKRYKGEIWSWGDWKLSSVLRPSKFGNECKKMRIESR